MCIDSIKLGACQKIFRVMLGGDCTTIQMYNKYTAYVLMKP